MVWSGVVSKGAMEDRGRAYIGPQLNASVALDVSNLFVAYGQYITYLYPKAALNTMTQTTTAFGVIAWSTYIHHPVDASATHICVGNNIKH